MPNLISNVKITTMDGSTQISDRLCSGKGFKVSWSIASDCPPPISGYIKFDGSTQQPIAAPYTYYVIDTAPTPTISPTPIFSSGPFLSPGNYALTIFVKCSDQSDILTRTVNLFMPTVNAGPDKTINQGATTTVGVATSDTKSTYLWTADNLSDFVSVSDRTNAVAQVRPKNHGLKRYTVTARDKEFSDCVATDYADVMVNPCLLSMSNINFTDMGSDCVFQADINFANNYTNAFIIALKNITRNWQSDIMAQATTSPLKISRVVPHAISGFDDYILTVYQSDLPECNISTTFSTSQFDCLLPTPPSTPNSNAGPFVAAFLFLVIMGWGVFNNNTGA